jgi:hypothetical protein
LRWFKTVNGNTFIVGPDGTVNEIIFKIELNLNGVWDSPNRDAHNCPTQPVDSTA